MSLSVIEKSALIDYLLEHDVFKPKIGNQYYQLANSAFYYHLPTQRWHRMGTSYDINLEHILYRENEEGNKENLNVILFNLSDLRKL